jgi:hypothetical protein
MDFSEGFSTVLVMLTFTIGFKKGISATLLMNVTNMVIFWMMI